MDTTLNLLSTRKMRFIRKKECFLADVSLICGILGLIFFGILSLPAIVFALAAKKKIENRNNKLCGMKRAITGFTTGLAGCMLWGVLLVTL